MPEYNKLVRDGIPRIIEASGAVAVTRVLDLEEFKAELVNKDGEERAELSAAETPEEQVEEVADLDEVRLECDRQGIEVPGTKQILLEYKQRLGSDKVEKIRLKKLEERGGFGGRIFLERTE